MKLEEYNKIFPIGTVIQPIIYVTTSFTTSMFKEEKKKTIKRQINELNKNDFNAIWEYKEGLGIVRIK